MIQSWGIRTNRTTPPMTLRVRLTKQQRRAWESPKISDRTQHSRLNLLAPLMDLLFLTQTGKMSLDQPPLLIRQLFLVIRCWVRGGEACFKEGTKRTASISVCNDTSTIPRWEYWNLKYYKSLWLTGLILHHWLTWIPPAATLRIQEAPLTKKSSQTFNLMEETLKQRGQASIMEEEELIRKLLSLYPN